MASAYANLTMVALEEDLVYVSHHFTHVLGWWRYIDDVLLLWTGTLSELTDFHDFLNTIDNDIKFTLTYSKKEIQFLDVLIRNVDNNLVTEVFVKPTDRNNILCYDSFHPRRMVESLPLSQLLRVRRIISEDVQLTPTLDSMVQKFEQRGYPRKLMRKLSDRVSGLARTDLLSKSNASNPTPKRIPFITSFCEESRDIVAIIKRHWSILEKLDECYDYLDA
ncbi:unnamed protein product [Ranitomeya imitator]|uniref:Helix-turn-helix domain-containing protein n=1 Tax=Ranitomeya imitator TaxID=111125 RepID=A0ABN9M125_9NEOB|nr:unnamed protein product [Ranitomeya imitator]